MDAEITMKSTPVSPLYPAGQVKLIREIPREWLVSLWIRKCRIDPSPWLPKDCPIRLFKCQSSGVEFYDPPFLAAPPEFYSLLQHNGGGYYSDSKWEFYRAMELVQQGTKVLDVGCGDGAFLKLVRDQKGCIVRGLETNKDGRIAARNNGIEVLDQVISDHQASNPDSYDVVASFQVLEHLVDPLGFLLNLVKLVRPGGLIILAVPNARSYLDWVNNPMDMPPHHMTRWDRGVFTRLPNEVAMEVLNAEEEPLQPEQRDIFLNATFMRLGMDSLLRSDTLASFSKLLLMKVLAISPIRRRFHGQSLLVTFRRI